MLQQNLRESLWILADIWWDNANKGPALMQMQENVYMFLNIDYTFLGELLKLSMHM